jgi:YgiT-type zinc finger domain-containing protein
MSTSQVNLKEKKVSYSIEYDGKFYIIENVPARINEETGEQFFAPETVEKIQQTIKSGKNPDKVMETPVFDYSATKT